VGCFATPTFEFRERHGRVDLSGEWVLLCWTKSSAPELEWLQPAPWIFALVMRLNGCGTPGLRWAHNRIGDVSGRRPDCMLRRFCWTVGVIEHLFVERPQVKQYSPLL